MTILNFFIIFYLLLMETKDINILVIAKGPAFVNAYEETSKKLAKNYPNVHLYRIEPNDNYTEDLNKLKDIKFDILTGLPLFIPLTKDILNTFPTIKWFHSLAAGIEKLFKIDNLINNDNIIISNSKGAYSDSLGEIGITAMMYFAYQIYPYIESQQKREWTPLINTTLYKKNLLILGFGNNGISLAKKAKLAFNMNINAVKKRISDNFEGKEYLDNIYTFDSLPDKIINEADYIYATLPETKETINLFNQKFFEKMNKNAVFINVGRGNAVVEDDIVYALENNIIKGALLDVTPQEPLNKDSKLYNISPKKLLITNHTLCFNTETVKMGFEFFYNNLQNYISKGVPITIIDKKLQY